ncbi:MAG TPA: phage major capsid protein, partial [Gemmataceae bacterium]|nr:phage major capsid protein [Gemmataceae bacterium]
GLRPATNPDGTPGGMTGVLSRAAEILGRDGARVKSAAERYAHTKKAAVYPDRCGLGTKGSPHPFAGRPAQCAGVNLDLPSDRDKALSQAWFKWALTKSNDPRDIPRVLQMTEEDKDLLQYALRNSQWTGLIAGEYGDEPHCVAVNRRLLTDYEQKALLDDTTSGGLEITPIEFDDALVTIPVLYGELFPLVNVINVSRGRRMKGGVVSNPAFTSGAAEGTSITTFNTSSFVSAFDTTIFVAVAAMELGLDFEEDSPTGIASIILQKYGEKALEWLDRVVAVGDGVTEPQGVFTSSAVTVLTPDFPVQGPWTIGDLEGGIFGVAKQFRQTKGSRNVFIGNDTTYRRVRSTPVGPGDERRVFGMDHASYQAMEYPFKIQNNIANSNLGFFNLGYYRMYRRLGMNVRIETQGAQLAQRNTRLIVVRMRYGGQIELGGAGAAYTNGQN